jgi:hypothetical protein
MLNNFFSANSIRIGLLILLMNQSAVAHLCRSQLGDDTLVAISSYDLQPLYKDPIGPFQIESIFHDVRRLLGQSNTPESLHVKVVSSDSKIDSNSSVMLLKIGYRFNEAPPANRASEILTVVQAYAHKWIDLNLNNASPVLKEFLAQSIALTYMGNPLAQKNLSPLAIEFWNAHSEKIRQEGDFRRSVIPRLIYLLKENSITASTEEISRILKILN